jgi:hypoxanthine phosphoribosyltransferase
MVNIEVTMSDIITIHDLQFTEFISPDSIAKRVYEIAQSLNSHFAEVNEITVLVTLKGAFIFAADLVRHMRIPMHIDMIRASSYKGGTISSGVVTVNEFAGDYAGKHILIIEDIIDSGRTIKELKRVLETMQIASCTTVSLFSKPDQHSIDLSKDFIGFEIPPVFIIGYGLDYQEKGRELPGIWQCID